MKVRHFDTHLMRDFEVLAGEFDESGDLCNEGSGQFWSPHPCDTSPQHVEQPFPDGHGVTQDDGVELQAAA